MVVQFLSSERRSQLRRPNFATSVTLAIALVALVACTSGAGTPQASCGSGQELTPNETARLCDEVIAAGCERVIQHDGCVALVGQFFAELAGDCCADAAVKLYRCGLANGFRCAEISDDVLFTPACSEAEEQFDECRGSHDNCSQSVSPGEWLVECDQYSAVCNYNSTGHDCRCTFGPHTGTVFSAPADDVVPSVELACK